MNRSLFAVASVLVAASAVNAQVGPNLLNNPGFESPLGFDFSNPFNWNGFFGGPAGVFLQAFNDTGATPRSGSNALVTTIRGAAGVTDGFNAFTGHVQIVQNLTPGTSYQFSVFARTNPRVLDGAEFRIEWQNAAGQEVSRNNSVISSLLSSSYQQFSISEAAPAGAVRAALVLAVQSGDHTGPIADTSVAFDDASFQSIPAPAAATLLGLGGLLAARRRR